jgi:hypothetical protein
LLNYQRQILVASEIMVLIGIVMSFCFTPHYSVPQYVTSALITFVFAEVLEGKWRLQNFEAARGVFQVVIIPPTCL